MNSIHSADHVCRGLLQKRWTKHLQEVILKVFVFNHFKTLLHLPLLPKQTKRKNLESKPTDETRPPAPLSSSLTGAATEHRWSQQATERRSRSRWSKAVEGAIDLNQHRLWRGRRWRARSVGAGGGEGRRCAGRVRSRSI
ncbi:hypothetical protein E3N88_33731 [Mikania micrantha]|uniref:Uncharacterized protein n=1 Tax=Mikania micrantha TaxID=192012 RepID=A0A5N6MCC8_9ASTR|nr:hypothetical protein E3N88_33731 [Mikania micrantha]